ncbi:hypothetical protein NHX12_026289 [Muraenolepis orangiensis]|uniref:Uncharacterized protein n=1 Tax=Muraenolepis orangiensis TaxID=630683 RepID=A0A9Q0EJZ7_9TELE|nr:hypothetical protein NHX12_026289 [Muraenolepis orangiensis]
MECCTGASVKPAFATDTRPAAIKPQDTVWTAPTAPPDLTAAPVSPVTTATPPAAQPTTVSPAPVRSPCPATTSAPPVT